MRDADRPMIDSLESRLFLSAQAVHDPLAPLVAAPAIHASAARRRAAAAATINIEDLLGFTRRGAWWKYNTNFQIAGDAGNKSGSGPATVAVGKRTAKYNGQKSNIVTFSAAGAKLSTAWSTDSTGTDINAVGIKAGFGKVDLKLHGTQVAPTSLTIGQPYSDNGTFDGKITAKIKGRRVTGTVNGTSSATSELTGTESITVPAGTFSATKGIYSVRFNGTIRVRYAGQTFTANFTATVNETFWAVQGTGVVKAITSANAKVDLPIIGSKSATLSATSELTSFKV